MRNVVARRAYILLLGLDIMIGVTASISAAQEAPRYNRLSAVYPKGRAEHGRILAASCTNCHSAASPAVDNPPFHAPKLRYQRPSTLFYALQDYRSGARKSDLMQPVAQALSDQDMRDLALYLSARTLRSRIPPRPKLIADTPAHQKNSQVCGMCHGETGLGEMDGYPVIGGQHRDYIEHALHAYRAGERTNPIMQRFARSLKPAEVRMMADYFAGQSALEPIQ